MPKGFLNENETNEKYLSAWDNDPWGSILRDAHEKMTLVDPGYRIDQIKEKFNGLRYYYRPSLTLSSEKQAELRAIVNEAAAKVAELEELASDEG